MCFGDSITIGARSYCGYPEYTGNFLEQDLGNKWNVINHAVSRYTAMDLARYITANFSNLKQFEPGVISVLIGTNDVKLNTAPSDYKIALEQVILKSMMMAQLKNVVLIKIPSLPKKVSYPYLYSMNERIITLNQIIQDVSAAHGLRTLELQLSDADLFDGVHLNAAGSKNAGQQLARFILADKGAEYAVREDLINLPPQHV